MLSRRSRAVIPVSPAVGGQLPEEPVVPEIRWRRGDVAAFAALIVCAAFVMLMYLLPS